MKFVVIFLVPITIILSEEYTKSRDNYIGGVVAYPTHHFRTVNGYSNFYSGWGGEDDDMLRRLTKKGVPLIKERSQKGMYFVMSHGRQPLLENRKSLIKLAESRMDKDGLNSVRYKLEVIEERRLFTWILITTKSPSCVYPEFKEEHTEQKMIGYVGYNSTDTNSDLHNLDGRKSPSPVSYDPDQHIDEAHLPLIYVITPTKYRTEQKADLTRMSHTLRLVPRIHWIVIEDRAAKSDSVAKFLNGCALNYTHLAFESNFTEYSRLEAKGLIVKKRTLPKGVWQRNLALDWITEHGEFPSVFYFGDDDNTYDLRVFKEIRFTKRISVFPVGLVCDTTFEAPIVRKGKVVGFASACDTERKFPMDMAGFAVNSEILKRPKPPRFGTTIAKGYLETNFIEQLNVPLGEMEPKADNCTKVLVWHTRTKETSLRKIEYFEEILSKHNMSKLDV